jgi:hypothetical protein
MAVALQISKYLAHGFPFSKASLMLYLSGAEAYAWNGSFKK